MKKERKPDNWQITIVLIVLSVVGTLTLDYWSYSNDLEKSKINAQRYENLLSEKIACGEDKVFIVNYNKIQLNGYCYLKAGIEKKLITESDFGLLIRWFNGEFDKN